MAHRDFAARRGSNKKKKKDSNNKNMLIGIAFAVLFAFGTGLYFLKSKAPEGTASVAPVPEKTQPKSVLPNRPEEVWSYIKALESRTVPVDDKPSSVEKNMRLTEEQRQVLIQMEKEQKAAEDMRKAAEQKAQAQETAQTDEAKAEAKKSAETVKKAEAVKVETAKKVETKAAESKPVETVAAGSKRFGLQCGAFKNRAQAESLQGRLAMAGVNAQVLEAGEWNRVRVGPFPNREGAVQAQDKAKEVISCVIIGM